MKIGIENKDNVRGIIIFCIFLGDYGVLTGPANTTHLTSRERSEFDKILDQVNLPVMWYSVLSLELLQ